MMKTCNKHGSVGRKLGRLFLAALTIIFSFPATLLAGSCDPAPPGLISWWRAEGNAMDTVGGNNGILVGGAGFVAGEVGQAFSFNGAAGFVQVPDASSLDFQSNSPISIELWAYRSGTETTMHLLGKRVTGCGAVQYEMYFNPYVGLALDTGNGSVQTGWQMPLNTWVHLTATFDGTNTFRFYTNGVLAGTGNGNLGAPNSGPFTIGTSGGCSYFTGLLDEISLYSGCLTVAEIQAIYSAGSSGKCFTPPAITNQPQPAAQTLLAGETAVLTVGATGSTPLDYQWLLNGTNILGATNNPLILTNVQTKQSGTYSVLVSNYAGAMTSSNATLTVVAPVPGQVIVADQAGLLSGLASGGHVTFAVSGVIYLSQTITVSNNVTLDATGHSVGISGSNSVRAFYVNPGVQLGLINLTISNGTFLASYGNSAYAGAIYNSNGTVDLVNCVLVGNSCVGGSPNYMNGFPAYGGAIYNDGGLLNITNSDVLTNTAVGGFGAGNGYYLGGTGGDADGGAIYNNGGTVNAVGSSFAGNDGTGGGIENGVGFGGSAFGGALFTTVGTVTITNCSFISNSVSSQDLAGALPGQAGGGAIYQQDGTLVLSGVVFSTNTAIGGNMNGSGAFVGNCTGGGIFSGGTLDVANCAFLGNLSIGATYTSSGTSGLGGAIYNDGYATIVSSTFWGNDAIGGSPSFSNSGAIVGLAYGGALYNNNAAVVVNTVLSGNASLGGSNAFFGPGGNAFGGAIYSVGSIWATNDTVAQNLAQGGPGKGNGFHAGNGNGGGLFNQGGTAILDYQTIASNSAVGYVGVGGGINATNGSLLLLNSIVAENVSGSDFFGSYGALTDGGDNLSSDFSFPFSAPGSMNNTNPELGPLSNNGGPTQTMSLLAGSPAIDAAGAGDTVSNDQRGFPRPSGPEPDIGAFEFQYVGVYFISGTVSGPGFSGEVSLTVGSNVISTQNNGHYELGLTNPGNYLITPVSTNYLFVPSNILVSVGPSQYGLNFEAYPWNALTFEGSTGGFLKFRFTSPNGGRTFRTLASSNLVNWTPIATNTLGASNYFELSIPITNRINQFYRTAVP